MLQTTQWERPEHPAEGTAGSVTWADDIVIDPSVFEDKKDTDTDKEEVEESKRGEEEKVQIAEEKLSSVRSSSSKFCKKNTEYDSAIGDEKKSQGTVSNSNELLTSKSSPNRSSPILASKGCPSKCNLNYGRVTTTQLDALSTLPKEGHLLKQSSNFFSSRWNRKYFVLDCLRLECYEKSEHYFYGSRKPKVMLLDLSTCTSFTDDAATFIVKTTDEGTGHTLTWTLAAPNHTEKNEWVINMSKLLPSH
jgi:hypothetical protein